MKTRYEDYASMEGRLPCMLSPELVREAGKLSETANWHENLELQYCVSGRGAVLMDGERYAFSPGVWIAVNANAVHYTDTDDRICYTCLILDTAFCRAAGISPTEIRLSPQFRDDDAAALLAEMTQILQSDSPYRKAKLQAAVLNLLVLLCERHGKAAEGGRPEDEAFRTVRLALDYIHAHYAEKISLDALARQVLRDKYSLSRTFKRVTGRTVVEYINSYRCLRAMELLQGGARVNEAARQCGFRNDSFFSRTFLAYTGKHPRDALGTR